jgi:hypothetical protein
MITLEPGLRYRLRGKEAAPTRPLDVLAEASDNRDANFCNHSRAEERHAVKVARHGLEGRRFPTLWDTDSGEYVVQGYTITDPHVLAQLNIPEGEAVIRIPKGLMRYLPKDQHGAADR